MTNEMVLDRTSNLVMPSHYIELTEEEMSYVDGGGFWANLFSGVGVVLNLGAVVATFIPGCQPVALVAGIVGAVSDLIGYICGQCNV